MQTLFVISFALLWGLVVLESFLLREALTSTIRFKRLYSSSKSRVDPADHGTGAAIPDFSGTLLGTGETLSSIHLKGNTTTLLFVSPAQASLPGYRQLAAVIHALWHRMDGHIYLVCAGSPEACQQFAFSLDVNGSAVKQVPIVLDERAQITQSFQIDATPSAVEVDEDLRVARYGSPIVAAVEQHGETKQDNQNSALLHQVADQLG